VSNWQNHGVTRRFHMAGRAQAAATIHHNGNSIAEPGRPWTDIDQSVFPDLVNSTGLTFPIGAVPLQCMTGLNTVARYPFARMPTIELPALFVALNEVAPAGCPLSRVPYRAASTMRGSVCEIGHSLRRRANDREGPRLCENSRWKGGLGKVSACVGAVGRWGLRISSLVRLREPSSGPGRRSSRASA
jgi:hypothetical protein